MNKNTHMRFATLNARSLLGGPKQNKSKVLSKYLKSKELNLDFLCLQDISASQGSLTLNEDQIMQIQRLFPETSMIANRRVAIIILNPRYNAVNEYMTKEGRGVIIDIVDTTTSQHICHILNIYAPANRIDRPLFYHNLQQLLSQYPEQFSNMIIMGDFNLHLNRAQIPSEYSQWSQWLHTNFTNCFGGLQFPTYASGRYRTTIDYIFAHNSLVRHIRNPNGEFLPRSWTDHTLLTIDMESPGSIQTGPGVWRLNPLLFETEDFTKLFMETLDQFHRSHIGNPSFTKQQLWDSFKSTIKVLATQYGKTIHSKTQKRLRKLQTLRRELMTHISTKGKASATDLDTLEQFEQEIWEILERETKIFLPT